MKRYRWNYKKCFKNLATGLMVAAICIAFDFALFVAFWGEYIGLCQ